RFVYFPFLLTVATEGSGSKPPLELFIFNEGAMIGYFLVYRVKMIFFLPFFPFSFFTIVKGCFLRFFIIIILISFFTHHHFIVFITLAISSSCSFNFLRFFPLL